MQPDSTNGWVRLFQEQLLENVSERLPALSANVRRAFFDVPRHAFVSGYRVLADDSMRRVDPNDFVEHLPTLYRDEGLGIFGEDAKTGVTIAQPTFVLKMLDLLELSPGQRVFELGTGSGWNAALLGRLVSPGGMVETIEIIPELAARAERSIRSVGLENVRVIHGDGGQGPGSNELFDRAVFTAGSYDIPERLHAQVRVGGLLMFLYKCPGGGDLSMLLRREGDHFVRLSAEACMAVPVTGPSRDASYDSMPLARFEPWKELRSVPVRSRPFPCGDGRGDFAERTFGVRSFLSIVEPRMRYFLDEEARHGSTAPWTGCTAFGLWDEASNSLALFQDTTLTSYGNSCAADELDKRLGHWLALGMPNAAALHARAFPRHAAPSAGPGEWALDRRATRFIFSAGSGRAGAPVPS